MYNAETVEVLGKHYQMVTIEKWYTECGSKHPIQNGPWCNVEASMYVLYRMCPPTMTTITTRAPSSFATHFNKKTPPKMKKNTFGLSAAVSGYIRT